MYDFLHLCFRPNSLENSPNALRETYKCTVIRPIQIPTSNVQLPILYFHQHLVFPKFPIFTTLIVSYFPEYWWNKHLFMFLLAVCILFVNCLCICFDHILIRSFALFLSIYRKPLFIKLLKFLRSLLQTLKYFFLFAFYLLLSFMLCLNIQMLMFFEIYYISFSL